MLDNVAVTCRDHLQTEYLYQEPLQRQRGEILRIKQEEHLALPQQIDYFQVGSCCREHSLPSIRLKSALRLYAWAGRITIERRAREVNAISAEDDRRS